MNQRFGPLFPLIVIFILFSLIFILTGLFFTTTGVDFMVLVAANCLFFLVSLAAYKIQRKAMDNSNPNVFIRSVMGGMMLKMLICVAAVMAYVLLSGKHFNKPAVYISMVLYLVYLSAEVAIMMKLNKSKNA